MNYLLDKEESKELIDDYNIEIQRVYKTCCSKCSDEITIIKDNEAEIREELIDELDWNYVHSVDDETGDESDEIVCPDCKLLVV